jgi:hypothetical protein
MKLDLKTLIHSTPSAVKFSEIEDFDRLDERISAVGVLYVNTIGVCDGYIEFCPNNEPPLVAEILSWIWVFRPDLSTYILNETLQDDLKLLIKSYQTGDIDKWWNYINDN